MTAGTLTLAEQTLVVFVNDTGHERLVEGHPVYGLGGCAAIGTILSGSSGTCRRKKPIRHSASP